MSATLPSNDGDAQLVIDLRMFGEHAHDPGFVASIHLRGQHWDGDHTFPFSTSIDGLWLRAADVKALQKHITEWLHQPLESQTVENLSADFHLARLPRQNLNVRFEPLSDQASSQHPLVTIHFLAGALQGEFHFFTDQSCLRLFAQELSTELTGPYEFAL